MVNHFGFDDLTALSYPALREVGVSRARFQLPVTVLGLHMQGLAGKQGQTHLRPPRVWISLAVVLMSTGGLFS